MSIHDGHRQRLKKRFLNEGLDHFEELQVLELLLFYAIPRQDTNPIAHALLERFGSLAQVMEAPVEELKKVPGMGESASAFLSLVTATCRYYLVNRSSSNVVLNTVEQCGNYLLPFFCGRRNETVYLLCLDAKCKVLACKEVGEGSVNSAAVPIRRIVEMALSANATSVVLAHNHPSGMALPSGEDQLTTKRLAMSLAAVDIELVDHLVVADDDYVSLRQSGWYHPDECCLPL
jgi:DNA repair protein RadC